MSTPDLSCATWRKSTRSNGNGGNCVEVGFATTAVAVRDTKDRQGGTLAVSCGGWSSFLAQLKQGSFDLR